MKRCPSEGAAVRVESMEKAATDFAVRSSDGYEGRYRVKMRYWHSCKGPIEGLPAGKMECEGPVEVYSEEFTIHPSRSGE